MLKPKIFFTTNNLTRARRQQTGDAWQSCVSPLEFSSKKISAAPQPFHLPRPYTLAVESGTESSTNRLPDEFTDDELLRRATALGGDEGAFLALYERHHAAVYRFARRLMCDDAAAEDAVHDCFLDLVRRPRFDAARGPLRNYLYGMVRHRALKSFRRAGRECELDEAAEESLVARDSEPLARLLDEELSETVRRAVARLPPLQREALVLYQYEEL